MIKIRIDPSLLRGRCGDKAGRASAAERTGIAHVAFVEVHVCVGEIGGVDYRAGLAKIQVDVQVELFRGDRGTELLEGRLRRLAAAQAPENLPAARRAVADVH